MAIEENTLIIVSAPYVVLFFTQFSSNAKITAKNITDIFTLDIPNSVPMAIPHIAECPRASEKKPFYYLLSLFLILQILAILILLQLMHFS